MSRSPSQKPDCWRLVVDIQCMAAIAGGPPVVAQVNLVLPRSSHASGRSWSSSMASWRSCNAASLRPKATNASARQMRTSARFGSMSTATSRSASADSTRPMRRRASPRCRYGSTVRTPALMISPASRTTWRNWLAFISADNMDHAVKGNRRGISGCYRSRRRCVWPRKHAGASSRFLRW